MNASDISDIRLDASHACASAPVSTEQLTQEAEGFDSELELARHLVFDCNTPTDWALDKLGAGAAIDWELDDGVLQSDCGRYDISEDPIYGVLELCIDGELEAQSMHMWALKRAARAHKVRSQSPKPRD